MRTFSPRTTTDMFSSATAIRFPRILREFPQTTFSGIPFPRLCRRRCRLPHLGRLNVRRLPAPLPPSQVQYIGGTFGDLLLRSTCLPPMHAQSHYSRNIGWFPFPI